MKTCLSHKMRGFKATNMLQIYTAISYMGYNPFKIAVHIPNFDGPNAFCPNSTGHWR